jgi:uncharacterized protein (TIGR02285 family)
MRTKTVIAGVLLALQLGVATATELVWETLPIAGVAELKNGKPADGLIHASQLLIEEQIPELQHRYEVSTLKRLELNMARGKHRCSTATLRHPGRDAVGYFVPFLPTQPMQLVTRRDLLKTLPMLDGQVVFSDLIRMEKLKGLIVSSRGYPDELKGLLTQGVQSDALKVLSSASSGANVVSMIQHRRADYTLEFPIVLQKILTLNDAEGSLLSLPILENQTLTVSGIYCSKTAWGKDMAKRIDQAIQRAVGDTERVMRLYQPLRLDAKLDNKVRAYLKSRAQQASSF